MRAQSGVGAHPPGASSGSGDHSLHPGPVSPVSWAQSQGPVQEQSGDGLGAQAVPGVEQGGFTSVHLAQARERRSQQVAVLGEPQAGAPGHEAPFLPHAWALGMTGPQECRVPEASSCWCPAGIHLGTAGPQAEMVAGTLGWGCSLPGSIHPTLTKGPPSGYRRWGARQKGPPLGGRPQEGLVKRGLWVRGTPGTKPPRPVALGRGQTRG